MMMLNNTKAKYTKHVFWPQIFNQLKNLTTIQPNLCGLIGFIPTQVPNPALTRCDPLNRLNRHASTSLGIHWNRKNLVTIWVCQVSLGNPPIHPTNQTKLNSSSSVFLALFHARVCLLCFIILLFFALTLPLNQADCMWPTKSFFTNKRKEKTIFSAPQVELNGIVLEMHIWALILCCNFSSRRFSYISDWRKTAKNSCCFSWVCALQENKFRSLNGPPDSILVMDYL